MPESTAVLFNANDPQLPQAHLFLESLRDENRGAYGGDIWVLSTGLSPAGRRYVEQMNLKLLEDPLDYLRRWPGREVAQEFVLAGKPKKSPPAKAQSPPSFFTRCRSLLRRVFEGLDQTFWKKLSAKTDAAEEAGPTAAELEECYLEFRNKRCSKLIVLKFLEDHGDDYQRVIFCDTDVLAQGPLRQVVDQVVEDRLYYRHEENPILPGTPLWKKNFAYKTVMGAQGNGLDLGGHEINIGFLAAAPSVMWKLWNAQKELYLAEEHVGLISRGWHEQDFFRLLRAKRPEEFALFREGTVVHTCNGGLQCIKQVRPMMFQYADSGLQPAMVHFAGGTWAEFKPLSATYNMDFNAFLAYYAGSAARPARARAA